MTLMGLIENRQGLYAARWFLGIAEAGMYGYTSIPSCLLLTVPQYVYLTLRIHTDFCAGETQSAHLREFPSVSSKLINNERRC
jgi:hypothetical protein